MTNYQNTIKQFLADLAENGMVVDEPIIADGLLHRVHVSGDKPGTKNGAYILHMDGHPAGYFEHFSRGLKATWRLGSGHGSHEMPLSMRRQIEAERHRRRDEAKIRQQQAAGRARSIWQRASTIVSAGQHAYLARKGVKPYSARLYRGALVIPLFDESLTLVNLQFIDAHGVKRFLAGGRKKDCFSTIGESSTPTSLLICEGWATGASLHTELGQLVMVAMDAGNLEPVARVARRLYPDAEIIIAGDNDDSGTGQAAAKKAALAIAGKYLIPDRAGADWNDVLSMGEG